MRSWKNGIGALTPLLKVNCREAAREAGLGRRLYRSRAARVNGYASHGMIKG